MGTTVGFDHDYPVQWVRKILVQRGERVAFSYDSTCADRLAPSGAGQLTIIQLVARARGRAAPRFAAVVGQVERGVVPQFGNAVHSTVQPHPSGWIRPEKPIQDHRLDQKGSPAAEGRWQPRPQQSQFRAEAWPRLGLIVAAFGSSPSAFRRGPDFFSRFNRPPLLQTQRIRPPLFHIHSRSRPKRPSRNRPLRPTGIEPSQTVRRLARLAHHPLIPCQQIHPVRVKPMPPHHRPQQQAPVQWRLNPPLQRPIAAAALGPARPSQPRHAPRDAQQGDDAGSQLAQSGTRNLGGKPVGECYHFAHGFSDEGWLSETLLYLKTLLLYAPILAKVLSKALRFAIS
jgi:hypothetical protein